MQLKPCDCRPTLFVREPRPGWMRLLTPNLRHWSCATCGRRFVASKNVVAVWQTERAPSQSWVQPEQQATHPRPTPTPETAG